MILLKLLDYNLFKAKIKIIEGKKIGHSIGFPTANLHIGEQVLPKPGVYATYALVGSSVHQSVTNIGMRPTFGGTKLRVESHLLDFSGDLYGSRLSLQFVRRIRDEIKFSSVEDLKKQIVNDIGDAKTTFSST